MRIMIAATLAVVLLLEGCATREELVAKSPVVPAGVNLSGQWRLGQDSRGTMQRIRDAEAAAAGGNEKLDHVTERKRQASRNRSDDGMLVRVFLEIGESLKVTQTDYGLFISFDRSVVEEYRFGEKREVNVGPVVADRVSGWNNEAYVIETLDSEGAKLIETYRLRDNGRNLIRTITILNDGSAQMNVEQTFDKT